MKTRIRSALLCAIFFSFFSGANAQNFPESPVKIIVPQPAGSGTDVIARLLAVELAKAMGQNFIVDNRPGANGISGAVATAQSRPDGYTLLLVAASVMTLNPHLFKDLPYEPEKSFAPVAFVGETGVMLATSVKSAYQTLPELIAAAKASKTGLSYGIPQVGSMPQLMGEIIRGGLGANLVAIPYRGGAATTTAMLAGEIDIMIDSITTIAPLARDGRVKILAVGSPKRLSGFPSVPALSEVIPGAEASGWFGLFAPKDTPEAVRRQLNIRIVAALQQPEFREKLSQLGVYPVADNTSASLGARMSSDLKRYGEIIKTRNIQAN
jgi:tripartite-type tricarboxylate transporter receptor subunit TctC